MAVEARERIAEVRAMLACNPEAVRQVIGALFLGPLTIAPIEITEGKRFWIKGSAVIGRMSISRKSRYGAARSNRAEPPG